MYFHDGIVQLAGTAFMVTIALTTSARAATSAGSDPRLRADLETLARRTVFFGHQSVGANILDGVRELAAQEGVALRIVQTDAPRGEPPGTWAHAPIGENGNPILKLRSFERMFAPGATNVDVALMKFCYVDFHAGTDGSALFAQYQSTIRELQRRFPGTAFVHVTAPLTTTQGGLKALVKRMLGREGSESQNARRERYNALVRQAYGGREPLFDLARIESTGPDGRPRYVDWNGTRVPVLAEAYTDDGGHLNAEGRRRVARELVAFLAALRLASADGSGSK